MEELQITDEEQLAREVGEDFETRRRQRKSLERQWELNLNFARGEQYCRITDGGEIVFSEPNYDWEQRRVFNHIAPIIDTRLSKLARIRPALAVRAASDGENCLSRRASPNRIYPFRGRRSY